MLDNFKKLPEDYQSSIIKGVDTLFALQKQLLETTFDVYEKSIQLREGGYSKTKGHVEELSTTLEKQLSGGQEKVKSALTTFAEKYLPESKEKVAELQKLVQENVEKISAQMKVLLKENVDQNVKKALTQEKEILKKLRELFQSNLKTYQGQVHALLGVEAPKPAPAPKAEAPKAAKKTTAKKAPAAKPSSAA